MYAESNDKPGVEERYSTAVSSSNLAVNPRTSMSDTDVLGAMGLADRELTQGRKSDGTPVRPAPLAVALERLLSGDSRAAHGIVRGLADAVWKEARGRNTKLTHLEATHMAKVLLAWMRDGVCKTCGGHGYQLIPGTKTHSVTPCRHCSKSETPGKRPLFKEFRPAHRDLADWLRNEVQREAGRAAPQAMAHLASTMDL